MCGDSVGRCVIDGRGGCIDPIEIGSSPGNRLSCQYDANPPVSGATGSADRMITVPAASGRVDLRFNLGQNYGCMYMGASGWWAGAPGASQTFGAICVTP